MAANYAHPVRVAPGERFVVLQEHDLSGLTAWSAPFTGDFACTLPAGLVLVCESGQFEGAIGFACKPEEYESFEPQLVPKRDRDHPQYGGYWFVLLESEIGTWFDRAPSASRSP